MDRYDLYYKTGPVFQPVKAVVPNSHSVFIAMLMDDEHGMSYKFDYIPSDESYSQLYNLIRSACDTLGIQITNVVEHKEDYNVVYYMRTSSTFSYIKVYVNAEGFITYAKPMSLKGTEDRDLCSIVEIIKSHFI